MKSDSPNIIRTFIDAWRGRGNLGDNRLGSIERNFLPAALEIQETPPSPVGRILAWSLMILFTIAIIWACFGKVDIVCIAEGKTIPSGYVKQIQPLEKGVVKAILVKEGQLVQQGQPLIELDRTLTAADQTKLSKDLAYLDQTIRRQELFVKLLANPDQAADIRKLRTAFTQSTSPSPYPSPASGGGDQNLHPSALNNTNAGSPGALQTDKHNISMIASSPSSSNSLSTPRGRDRERGATDLSGHPERSEGSHSNVGWVEQSATHQSTQQSSADVDDQFDLLLQQWRSHQTQRETLKSQLREKQAEKQSSLEIVRQLEATVPLIAKRTESSRKLTEEGIVAEGDYLKLKEEHIQKSQALAAERARQVQISEAMDGILKQLSALDAEAERKALSDIQDAQRQRQASLQELQKASDLNARQVLYAPVAGKVQQLAITTIGGVVQPAQVLMLIVPGDDKLEVEASIQNKDIGFVHVGQKAEIKVNTFPFTKYGVIDAEVMDISKDSLVQESPAAFASKDAKPEDKQQGLIYKMRLKMAKSWLMVDGKQVELIPGMAVQAEVKTGKRRLIEFFLSPLLKYGKESVRER